MPISVKLGSLATKAVELFTGPFGKILTYACLAGVLAYGARLWLNAHDDKVWKESQAATSLSMKKELDKEFAIRLEANGQIVRQALADKAKSDERYVQIVHLFDQAFARLRDIRAAIDERQVIYVEKAAAVPPAELDATIRAVSNDIARRPADGQGEGAGPGPVVPAPRPPQ